MRSIVGQQLSTKAARAIYGRLTDRFGGRTPTPAEVLADDPDELRTAAGLSHAKVRYLRSLAEHVLDGSLELERLDALPDDEVIAELVAVKGIGAWSAHMFLMFHLRPPRRPRRRRPRDPQGGDDPLRAAGAADHAELEAIAEPWRPYRTLACRFLWRSSRATPSDVAFEPAALIAGRLG